MVFFHGMSNHISVASDQLEPYRQSRQVWFSDALSLHLAQGLWSSLWSERGDGRTGMSTRPPDQPNLQKNLSFWHANLISCERVAMSWRLVCIACRRKREKKKKKKKRDRDRGQERVREREREGERYRERERERKREKMWRCEDVKMRRWEDVKMWRCEFLKMWRWEDVSMWTSEDVKMWTCEDLSQNSTFRRMKNLSLRRSREQPKNTRRRGKSGKITKNACTQLWKQWPRTSLPTKLLYFVRLCSNSLGWTMDWPKFKLQGTNISKALPCSNFRSVSIFIFLNIYIYMYFF